MILCSSGLVEQNLSLLSLSAQVGAMFPRQKIVERKINVFVTLDFYTTTAVSKEGLAYCVMGKHESSFPICTVRPYVFHQASNHHNLRRALYSQTT